MAPVPGTLFSTPKRPIGSRSRNLVSTAITNNMRFKTRSFRIPKCNVEGRKNIAKLRDRYLSPLFLLDEDYRDFSKSLDDLRPRRLDGVSEQTEIPVPQNSPVGSVAERIDRRVSDAECDYYPFYHVDDDCNCKECENSPAYWSEDSEDEDDTGGSNNSVNETENKKNSPNKGVALTENSNSVGSFSAMGIDMNFAGGQMPNFGFHPEVFSDVIPNSSLEQYGKQESDSGIDLHSFGEQATNSSMEMDFDRMQITDESQEVEDIGRQIQNLHLETNESPRRDLVNYAVQVDELIINLFPHETAESLFPNNFSNSKYNRP